MNYYIITVNRQTEPICSIGWSKNLHLINLYKTNYLQKQTKKEIVLIQCNSKDELTRRLYELTGSLDKPAHYLLNDTRILLIHDRYGKPIGITTRIGYRSFKKVTLVRKTMHEINKGYYHLLAIYSPLYIMIKLDEDTKRLIIRTIRLVCDAVRDKSINFEQYAIATNDGQQYVGKL